MSSGYAEDSSDYPKDTGVVASRTDTLGFEPTISSTPCHSGERVFRSGLKRPARRAMQGLLLASCSWHALFGQQVQTYTWAQIRDKFEKVNPTLRAGQLNIDESRAQEITAYLRPNPDAAISADGTQLTPYRGIYRPFAGTQISPSISYLHERARKRELRLENAEKGTAVTRSQQDDLVRTMTFNLRSAFVQTLQAKAVLAVAVENLTYYDKVIALSRDRLAAGDMARVDLDRIELARVQYESELEQADVSLRTAKIQLLTLLNDRTPINQFDVSGPFEFSSEVAPLDEIRRAALEARPDLKAAMQSVDQARTAHQLAIANGSTDPTFSLWWTHNPSFNNPYDFNTIGFSVDIPLRIFDRNQGEKERTAIDIQKNQRQEDAAAAQVLSDVDSAYATLQSNLNLLRPYRDKYMPQALSVRETVSFAWQHGGAALIDFLNAQNDYRSIQLNYLDLVGSYLTAASQLNLAVGREVIQ
jgi:cobalt-zinc-cadmium efflux system outer membrane protein